MRRPPARRLETVPRMNSPRATSRGGSEARFYLLLVIMACAVFFSVVRVHQQPWHGEALVGEHDDEAAGEQSFSPPAKPEQPAAEKNQPALLRKGRVVNSTTTRRWMMNTTARPAVPCDWTARKRLEEKKWVEREDATRTGFVSIDAHVDETRAPIWRKKPKLPETCGINFTLATQSTPERLWMLRFICRRWSGPIVIAVYAESKKIVERESSCAEGQVDYRIVSASVEEFKTHTAYPVNVLRNLAIAHVRTSHFLLCDIDLWPDGTLLRRLRTVAATEKGAALFRDPRRAVVIPAFSREVKTECSSSTAARDSAAGYRMRECFQEAERMPRSFNQLKDCIINKQCHIFDRFNQDGHGTTDYRQWLAQDSQTVRDVPCFLSNRYEPYVVLQKSPLLPPFEEQFTGYGKNKIQNLVHLRYVGWHFSVLPRSYLIHFPHHKSAARMAWEQRSTSKNNGAQADEHRAVMDRLYRRFLDTLIEVYGSPGARADTTTLCSSSVVALQTPRPVRAPGEAGRWVVRRRTVRRRRVLRRPT